MVHFAARNSTKLGLVIVYSIVAVLWAMTCMAENPSIPTYKDALVAIHKADYDNALKILNELIANDDNNPKYLTQKGQCLLHLGKINEGLVAMGEALSISPNSSFALQAMLQGYTILNKSNEVREYSDRIIGFKPEEPYDYVVKATVYYDKDPTKALALLDRAISLDNNMAEAYEMRGSIYRRMKEFNKSIRDYSKALEIAPYSATAYTNRGNSYRQNGDVDKAIADHTKAIRINGKFGTAYFNRGRAYIDKGNYKAARADWEKVLIYEPNNSKLRAFSINNLGKLKEDGH